MRADRVKTRLLFGGAQSSAQHARGQSENSAPLRRGSVQCVQKNGDSNETGYTGCSLSYVNSGITASSTTTESRSAGSRRHCTGREVYCTLAGVDRVIRVNTTAQL